MRSLLLSLTLLTFGVAPLGIPAAQAAEKVRASSWRILSARGRTALQRWNHVAYRWAKPKALRRTLVLGTLAAGLALSACTANIRVDHAPMPQDVNGPVINVDSKNLPAGVRKSIEELRHSGPELRQKAQKLGEQARQEAGDSGASKVTTHYELKSLEASGKGTTADPITIDATVKRVTTVHSGHSVSE